MTLNIFIPICVLFPNFKHNLIHLFCKVWILVFRLQFKFGYMQNQQVPPAKKKKKRRKKESKKEKEKKRKGEKKKRRKKPEKGII